MLEEFKGKLLSDDIRDVYQRYLLGHDIWYFREKKALLASQKIMMNSNSLCLRHWGCM